MRTTIEIDDNLIEEASRLSGLKTKRVVVDEALREFVRARYRQELISMIGSPEFDIDITPEQLDELRGKPR